jgi:Tfp pilus assembly protein PilF
VSEQVGGAAGDWFQYGAFCLRTGQPGKAEECLREALSRDRSHVPSHVALAGVLWARGQPLQAEALLQAVTGEAEKGIKMGASAERWG